MDDRFVLVNMTDVENCVYLFSGVCRMLLKQDPKTPDEMTRFLALHQICLDLVDTIVEIERRPDAKHLAQEVANGRNAYHQLQEKVCEVRVRSQKR